MWQEGLVQNVPLPLFSTLTNQLGPIKDNLKIYMYMPSTCSIIHYVHVIIHVQLMYIKLYVQVIREGRRVGGSGGGTTRSDG